MFDEAMAAAVETAQKRLMSTADRGSVLMSVSEDLSELSGLVNKLDPSNIDFDKGGLERIKAINYWNRFEGSYPALKSLFERLGRSKKILHNSITTVKRFRDEYMKAYEDFRSVPEAQCDESYMQQAVVCENMSVLLNNTVAEHEATFEYLSNLLKLLEESIDISVFLAKLKFNRSFDDAGIVGKLSAGEVSNFSLQSRYSKLHDAVNVK